MATLESSIERLKWDSPLPMPRRRQVRSCVVGAFGQALMTLNRGAKSEAHEPSKRRPQDATEPSPVPSPQGRNNGNSEINRRQLPRRMGRCSVRFCETNGKNAESMLEREWPLHAAQHSGSLTDLSLTGVAFVCDHAVPAGVTLLMRIVNRFTGIQVEVAGRVLRVSVEPDNRCRVVATLFHPMEYPEYDSLGWSQMPVELV